MSTAELVVLDDSAGVAHAAAHRLVTALGAALGNSAHGADVVVTGGGVGIAMLAAVLDVPGYADLDWARVHVWWGDERWVPDGDPERNDEQARTALLDHLPLRPDRVHAMPARRDGAAIDADARSYADALARRAHERGDDGSVPAFDVLLLGLGPEGHVGSVFPHASGISADADTVISVVNSPKPPPERITLTLPAMRHAQQVWIIAAGAEKADAVAGIIAGRPEDELPASGARGRDATLLIVDRAAAAKTAAP
ncbi:MAG TPA: 6-phosphogluconolactonase [Mycobacteriales bacterium]|nr:6-phosphogluconolactonase [Mycobacteriales bacterium]